MRHPTPHQSTPYEYRSFLTISGAENLKIDLSTNKRKTSLNTDFFFFKGKMQPIDHCKNRQQHRYKQKGIMKREKFCCEMSEVSNMQMNSNINSNISIKQYNNVESALKRKNLITRNLFYCSNKHLQCLSYINHQVIFEIDDEEKFQFVESVWAKQNDSIKIVHRKYGNLKLSGRISLILGNFRLYNCYRFWRIKLLKSYEKYRSEWENFTPHRTM